MAEASGYKWDIFISHTHNDNAIVSGDKGWVDAFCDFLDNWLTKRRSLSGLKIWRDENRMKGNTVFDDDIKDAVQNSALFFALNSRNYRESRYCQDELSWFHQYNKDRPGGLRKGNQFRIFNILLNNIPHQQWPEALGKTGGFPIHDAKSAEDLGDFISPTDDRFNKQLRPIVDAVEEILPEFRVPPDVASTTSDAGSGAIKDAADTLQIIRDRVIQEVKSRHACVPDDVPPPMENDRHAEKVRTVLAQAQLSVHLFDKLPGRKITDRKETTYPREQLELAIPAKTKKIIWTPADLGITTIEDDAHRAFLQRIKDGERKDVQYEFVSGTPNQLYDFISQQIDTLSKCLPDGTKHGAYLIDTHQKDQRYAFNLAAHLAEKGIEVEFNHESNDPQISLTKFERSVRAVRNVIIIYGKVGAAWLQGRIIKVVKTISNQLVEGETTNLENIWVYLTPSSEGGLVLPKFPPIIKINTLDNSKSDTVDPHLIDRILQHTGVRE